MNNRVLIITPLYFGDASGASVYYQKLNSSLKKHGKATLIISEQIRNHPDWYYPLFPRRAGENKDGVRDYKNYALQNLLYIKMLYIVFKWQPSTVLIHSSFFNFPGIFGINFRLMKFIFPKINWIADVRDRLIKEAGARYLKDFDSIIACSKNVFNHIDRYTLGNSRLRLIPIIQNKFESSLSPLPREINGKVLPEKFILYVGAVKEEKNVHILIDTYLHYIKKQIPDYHLVIAGLIKTNNSSLISALNSEGIQYIGNTSHNETLSLIANSSLCVNLSPCEGMPRFSLESLSMQIPTVLPPNIPEFDQYCPDNVCNTQDPAAISKLCLKLIHESKPNRYPIEQHYEEHTIKQYLDII